jgi:surface antigen
VNVADSERVYHCENALSPADRRREENSMTRRIALLLLVPIAALAGPAVADSPGAYADDDIWILEDCTQDCLESAETSETPDRPDPDTGATASATPIETFQNEAGQHCREFEQTVTIGGREQQAYGTVCRMPDGAWKIMRKAERASAPPPPEATPIPRERAVYEPL